MQDEKKMSFRDRAGREWSTRFSIAMAIRLKDEARLDVEKIFDRDGAFVRTLLSDQYSLIQALEIVTEEQRKRLEVSRKDFLEAIDGEVLDEAFDALLAGISASLPKLQRRALVAMIPRIATGLDAMVSKVETQIEKAGSELETKLRDSGEVFGNSPGS